MRLGVFYRDADGQGTLGMFDRQLAVQPVIYANQVEAGAGPQPPGPGG
jgi:hypothetical protein